MEKIVFLERNTLDADVRAPSFEHEWRDYGETRPEEVWERLRDATIAVVNKSPLGADVLAQLPRLKLVAVAARPTTVDEVIESHKKVRIVAGGVNQLFSVFQRAA